MYLSVGVECVVSTIADKEGGIDPPIFIITIVYTNRIIIAITMFIIFSFKSSLYKQATFSKYIN